jgi:hypothetical protein
LFEYVGRLARRLHQLTPGRTVAISGFATGRMDPGSVEEFWRSLLRQAPVGLVLFQDGIGVRNLRLGELPAYLRALREAVGDAGGDLHVVTEVFTQVDRGVDRHAFRAVPATLDRIVQQLEIAHRFASIAVAFGVPEYMSPLGGEEAQRLFDSYLAWVRRGR